MSEITDNNQKVDSPVLNFPAVNSPAVKGPAKSKKPVQANKEDSRVTYTRSKFKKSEEEEEKKNKKPVSSFFGGLGAFRTSNLSKIFYQLPQKLPPGKRLCKQIMDWFETLANQRRRARQFPRAILPSTAPIQKHIISLTLTLALLRPPKTDQAPWLLARPSAVEAKEAWLAVGAASIRPMTARWFPSVLRSKGTAVVVVAAPSPRQVQVSKEKASKRHKSVALLEDRRDGIRKVPSAPAPLIMAVIQRDHRRLRQLLRDPQLDVNIRDCHGKTALHHAVSNRDVVAVKWLLKRLKLNLNVADNNGDTPLIAAFMRNYPSIIKPLLQDHRVDISATNCRGDSALTLALAGANEAVVILLLNVLTIECSKLESYKIIDVDTVDEEGNTPLMQAVLQRNHALVVHLMQAAVPRCNDALVVQLLQSEGVESNASIQQGEAALSLAVAQAGEAVVKLLLDAFATWHSKIESQKTIVDINATDEEGNTLLMQAVLQNNYALVAHLMQAAVPLCNDVLVAQSLQDEGLEINATTQQGEAVLSLAVAQADEAIVTLLVDAFATWHSKIESQKIVDINATDKEGNTPLIQAVLRDSKAMVVQLLRLDINATNHQGQSALAIAVESGNEGIVSLLLDALDITTQGANGEQYPLLTALFIYNHPTTILQQLLKLSTIDVNAVDSEGQTLLMWAASVGDNALVQQLLLRPEIAVNIQDNAGLSALTWAAACGQDRAIELLLQHPEIGSSVTATDHAGRNLVRVAQEGYLSTINNWWLPLAIDGKGDQQQLAVLYNSYQGVIDQLAAVEPTFTDLEFCKQAMAAWDVEDTAGNTLTFSIIKNPLNTDNLLITKSVT